MSTDRDLRDQLRRIDGKGYGAYKDIQGQYRFGFYTLYIDHVQGDPFAAPSRVRVLLDQSTARFPGDTFNGVSRNIGLCDYLTRCFHGAIRRNTKGSRGSGKSGAVAIDRPTQEVLERTSVIVDDAGVEARFVVALPAFGRRIAGRQAEAVFFEELPAIVEESLFFKNLDADALYRHVKTVEDADSIRGQLAGAGYIAFINDGAILPRRSGVDARPMQGSDVVCFKAPDEFQVEFTSPNSGVIRGMGVPKGVNLIVGGGYHGKSTLLSALEMGVYNHIPGDGREYVVSDPDTVKIRSEDGRRIEKVGITPFINNLPLGKRTSDFSSEDASGSTSQAANIIEALEIGVSTLLIDEDTSATNFMIRDHRMQELVAKSHEPITPFIDKVRQLYTDYGVSTVLVLGGSGDYFDVADHVICMQEYLPFDVTENAKTVARKYKTERSNEGGEEFGAVVPRAPKPESLDPSKGKRAVKIKLRGLNTIQFGENEIDLSAVEQLVDPSQTRAIAEAMCCVKNYADGTRGLREVIDLIMGDVKKDGLDGLSRRPAGDFAGFRRFELASAINRLRTLVVEQVR
ncbi:MAG: ABC-ATPase domain-containing protein [Verrucomicrobia bacterium]|nr:ABC-ATPase domain-containing protein [Verrucomicrobiota bacterium]MCF7707587.1 ABC-ATPase domain-containing protein [Verrucomicrobiota bacterium]